MHHKNFKKSIEIPSNVKVKMEGSKVFVEGPKGKLQREFNYPEIKLSIDGNHVVFMCDDFTKRDKTMFGTIRAHVQNMMRGVVQPYVYKLKIVSKHFPMTVTFTNKEFTIKNYLGERVPRSIKIADDVEIKIAGDSIEVKSVDVEVAGKTAAKIEQLARIHDKDERIFQDGIYITHKAGKEL